MESVDDYELVKVIVLFRHGARTPKDVQGLDLGKVFGSNYSLTTNGLRQAFRLGDTLKNKYVSKYNFISQETSHLDMNIFTTNTQRTIFTATSFMLGLLPGLNPTITFENSDDLKNLKNDDEAPIQGEFQPYLDTVIENAPTINVIPSKNDLYLHSHKCSLNGKPIKKLIKQINNECEEDYKKENKLPNIINITEEDKKGEYEILTKLLCIDENTLKNKVNKKGKPLGINDYKSVLTLVPYHFNKNIFDKKDGNFIYSDNARHLYVKTFIKKKYGAGYLKNYECQSNPGGKINTNIISSKFYENIINQFDKTTEKTYIANTNLNSVIEQSHKNKKLLVYSAHDTNIFPMIMTLFDKNFVLEKLNNSLENKDDFNFISVTFLSSMIFELVKKRNTEEYFVRIYYNGSMIKENLAKLNGVDISNQGNIPYDKFKSLLKSLINEEYKNLDGNDVQENEDDE